MGNTYLASSVTHILGREGLVIVQVSVGVIKHHHQSNWWRRIYLANYGQSPLREAESGTQAGIWRLELIQKSWRSTTYWLAHPGFLSLLPYSTLYHQARVVPPTVSWILPHQSSDQNTHYSFAHRPFLNWGSLLQKDSSLCWVDIKVTSIIRLGVRQLGDKFISQRTKHFCLFIESGLFHYINWTNAVYFSLKQLFLYGHINFTNHLKK